jgi:hypothetical protein
VNSISIPALTSYPNSLSRFFDLERMYLGHILKGVSSKSYKSTKTMPYLGFHGHFLYVLLSGTNFISPNGFGIYNPGTKVSYLVGRRKPPP